MDWGQRLVFQRGCGTWCPLPSPTPDWWALTRHPQTTAPGSHPLPSGGPVSGEPAGIITKTGNIYFNVWFVKSTKSVLTELYLLILSLETTLLEGHSMERGQQSRSVPTSTMMFLLVVPCNPSGPGVTAETMPSAAILLSSHNTRKLETQMWC